LKFKKIVEFGNSSAPCVPDASWGSPDTQFQPDRDPLPARD